MVLSGKCTSWYFTPTSRTLAGRFSTFLYNGFGIEHIETVAAEHVELFVKARALANCRHSPHSTYAVGIAASVSNCPYGIWLRLRPDDGLGVAAATTGELPYITVDDLDLDNVNGPRV